jgi:cytolysin-activating lysine-acyltransferase
MLSKRSKKTVPGSEAAADLDRKTAEAVAQDKGAAPEPPHSKAAKDAPTSGEPRTTAENRGTGPDETGSIFTQPTPAGAAKTLSAVLGEIVWLMSQSPLHKQFFISDLEWFVMTPVLLKQFRLFYAKDRPIGAAFWGFVNDEVEERLKAGTSKLRPQDWKSGDKLWVVEVIAPFGGAEEMVKDLKAKVFKEREIQFMALGADGRKVVRVF